MSQETKLPFDAEWSRADRRRFDEVVVFVHQFGGDRRSTLRHARMMNTLGYDCARFTLQPRPIPGSGLVGAPLPISADLRWGLRGLYAGQIARVLNAIHQPKIVYSLSMPSSAALSAIGDRQASGVAAMICDGGPFARLYECVWNLYEKQYRVESRLLRAAFTRASLFIWGPGFEREMAALLAQIPVGFPVLSIRGGRDPLVSPAAIDDFWALQSSLRVERLAFPQGGHLDALRLFPHEYSDCVENFLASTRASACDCAPGHTREQTQVR